MQKLIDVFKEAKVRPAFHAYYLSLQINYTDGSQYYRYGYADTKKELTELIKKEGMQERYENALMGTKTSRIYLDAKAGKNPIAFSFEQIIDFKTTVYNKNTQYEKAH